MSLTCSEATTRLNALDLLNEQFLKFLEVAQTGATTPAEARAALEKAKKFKVDLETGIQELSHELVLKIVVSEAINPYAEALKAAGLPADHPECREKKEMIFNLDTVIEKQCARYTEQDMDEWVTDIQGNKDTLAERLSDPEEIRKIEVRLREGLIPVVMPGRQIQMNTWNTALKNLKPVWVQNGTVKTFNDPYVYTEGYSQKMTANNDPNNVGFFRSIPDQPYLVWTRPTQTVDANTTGETVEVQKQKLAELHIEDQDICDATDLIPTEYSALQSLHTAEVKQQATEYGADTANQTVAPLDDANKSFTRFLSDGLFSDGCVPSAFFFPGGSRLHFGRVVVGVISWSGFRPAARS